MLNVHRNRLLGTGRRGEREYGGEGRGRLQTYRYTVTTRMISALRWAAVRAILMFQQEVMDKVTRQCPQTTTFLKRKRAEAVSNRGPSAYQPNALPLGSLEGICTVPVLSEGIKGVTASSLAQGDFSLSLSSQFIYNNICQNVMYVYLTCSFRGYNRCYSIQPDSRGFQFKSFFIVHI